jgi:hydrogenase expression/formation protein HypE
MTTKTLPAICPLPNTTTDLVLLAHGGGGRLMHRLLEEHILSQFQNDPLCARHDGAVLSAGNERLAFSTDS